MAARVKMSDSEKRVNKKMSDIPSIKRGTRTFLEVSRNSRAKNNGKEMYKKTVLHVQSCFFADFIVVFFFYRKQLEQFKHRYGPKIFK